MSEGQIITVVGAFLGAAVISFIYGFVIPWWRVRRSLMRAKAVLDEHCARAAEAGAHVTDLESIEQQLSFDGNLAHLWNEFGDTLHREESDTEFDDVGHRRTVRFRQTVPAEAYFSSRSLIEVPLRADFFKHLPGVLTGLGIIGTFGGLIIGLAQFDVSGDPEQVNASVRSLVGSVTDAFQLSALAIIASILVTVFEKAVVAGLNARVQALQHAIDRLFDAGAGEDYLSSIAERSEQSATHLAHLKDGLVNDLRLLFEELGEKQAASTKAAAELIGTSVTTTLEAPLTAMAAAMERSVEDQQHAVHHLMEASLDAFATRLEAVIGEKLTDAADHIQASAASLRQALIDAPAAIGHVVAGVEGVLKDIATSAEPIAANAQRIAEAAQSLATTVEQSTATLDYAIERFKRLGEQLTGSVASAEQIAEALDAGSDDARRGAELMADMATSYASATAELEAVLRSLATAAAVVKQDADAQARMVAAVEDAAQRVVDAQGHVEEFLGNLRLTLVDTHETFSREINGTLDRTHESFHHNLASATQTLADTVHGFSQFLEEDFKGSVDGLQQEFARLSVARNGHGG